MAGEAGGQCHATPEVSGGQSSDGSTKQPVWGINAGKAVLLGAASINGRETGCGVGCVPKGCVSLRGGFW